MVTSSEGSRPCCRVCPGPVPELVQTPWFLRLTFGHSVKTQCLLARQELASLHVARARGAPVAWSSCPCGPSWNVTELGVHASEGGVPKGLQRVWDEEMFADVTLWWCCWETVTGRGPVAVCRGSLCPQLEGGPGVWSGLAGLSLKRSFPLAWESCHRLQQSVPCPHSSLPPHVDGMAT